MNDLTLFVRAAADEANDPVFCKLRTVQESSKWRGNEKRSSFTVVASSDHRAGGSVDSASVPGGVLCSGPHSIFRCEEFRRLKPQERYKMACDKHLCFNCLKSGHRSSTCTLARTCSVPGCSRRHTRYLHQVVDPVSTDGRTRRVQESASRGS